MMKHIVTRCTLIGSFLLGYTSFIMPWKYVRYFEDKTSMAYKTWYSSVFDTTPVISGCRPAQVEWISEAVKVEFNKYSLWSEWLLILYALILLALLLVYKSSIMGLSRLWFVLLNIVVFSIAKGLLSLFSPFLACDPMPNVTVIYTSVYLPPFIFSIIGIALGVFSFARLIRE